MSRVDGRLLAAALVFAAGRVMAQGPPVPAGAEFQVNTYTTERRNLPSVASDNAGNFVVVWSSYGQDGAGDGVFGQRYASNGVPQGAEFQVNTYTPNYQYVPAVASDAVGNFVVAWSS